MTTPLRYGLIGAGMMGREHVRNIALTGGKVASLSDPDRTQQRLSSDAAGGARVFDDHRDLIASGGIDALVIASPNDTHVGVLRDIFSQSSLPVLVEKPVCTSLADVAALNAAASAHPAPVWVAMEYRYMPPVQELLAKVHGGEIGTLRMLSIREHRFPFLEKVGDWNRFSRRTGGTLVEKCCHFFDLMRLVARDEPVRVYASGAADVNHRSERYDGLTPDILDNAYVIVEFRSGLRAMLDLCMFAEGAYFQEEIAATGDKARVEALIPGPARFWPGGAERHSELVLSPREPKGPQRSQVHVDEHVLKAGDHHGSTYYQHLKFADAVRKGADVEVSMLDGLKAVVIGLAAETSAREHRMVEIDGLKFW